MMFLVGLADIGEAALKHGFHGKETEQHLEMAARNSDDVRRLVDGGRLTKLGGGTFVGVYELNWADRGKAALKHDVYNKSTEQHWKNEFGAFERLKHDNILSLSMRGSMPKT